MLQLCQKKNGFSSKMFVPKVIFCCCNIDLPVPSWHSVQITSCCYCTAIEVSVFPFIQYILCLIASVGSRQSLTIKSFENWSWNNRYDYIILGKTNGYCHYACRFTNYGHLCSRSVQRYFWYCALKETLCSLSGS